MKPFAYLHWSAQKELEAIYLYDGEYTYLEFPKLLISISSLSDACAVFETRSKAAILSAAFDFVEYDYVYSNDVAQTILFLKDAPLTQPRSAYHLEALPLSAVYSIASGVLHEQLSIWLADIRDHGRTTLTSEIMYTLSKIQSILNGERHA